MHMWELLREKQRKNLLRRQKINYQNKITPQNKIFNEFERKGKPKSEYYFKEGVVKNLKKIIMLTE